MKEKLKIAEGQSIRVLASQQLARWGVTGELLTPKEQESIYISRLREECEAFTP